jgi:hypothetical protein
MSFLCKVRGWAVVLRTSWLYICSVCTYVCVCMCMHVSIFRVDTKDSISFWTTFIEYWALCELCHAIDRILFLILPFSPQCCVLKPPIALCWQLASCIYWLCRTPRCEFTKFYLSSPLPRSLPLRSYNTQPTLPQKQPCACSLLNLAGDFFGINTQMSGIAELQQSSSICLFLSF